MFEETDSVFNIKLMFVLTQNEYNRTF
jgi:hypothetical protein